MANEPNYSRLVSFYIGNAIKYSVAGALIIERLRLVDHQCRDNIVSIANKKYLMASLNDFVDMFPFLSTTKIRAALNMLINEGAVERLFIPDSSLASIPLYALTEKGWRI